MTAVDINLIDIVPTSHTQNVVCGLPAFKPVIQMMCHKYLQQPKFCWYNTYSQASANL